MKQKIFFLILCSILFTFSIQASTIKQVTTQLNVRQLPNKESKILGVLSQGQQVETNESSNTEWDKIKFNNIDGYVNNSYLKNKEQEKTIIKKENIKLTPVYTIQEFQYLGIIEWNNWRWTYYLMSEFPGSTSTPVQGRYVNEDQFVCDGDGYVILASVDLPPYTIVETPFGYMGKVYDTGCPSGVLDVYTDFY